MHDGISKRSHLTNRRMSSHSASVYSQSSSKITLLKASPDKFAQALFPEMNIDKNNERVVKGDKSCFDKGL